MSGGLALVSPMPADFLMPPGADSTRKRPQCVTGRLTVGVVPWGAAEPHATELVDARSRPGQVEGCCRVRRRGAVRWTRAVEWARMTFPSITNRGEFFSNHYLDAVIGGDLGDLEGVRISRWGLAVA